MALQDNNGPVFAAPGGRLHNNDIPRLISPAFERMLPGKMLQESYYLLLMPRFARNFGDFLEQIENFFRIHIGLFFRTGLPKALTLRRDQHFLYIGNILAERLVHTHLILDGST